jgi:hypothetical protein
MAAAFEVFAVADDQLMLLEEAEEAGRLQRCLDYIRRVDTAHGTQDAMLLSELGKHFGQHIYALLATKSPVNHTRTIYPEGHLICSKCLVKVEDCETHSACLVTAGQAHLVLDIRDGRRLGSLALAGRDCHQTTALDHSRPLLMLSLLLLSTGTGHRSARSSSSADHLLNQIASSTPYHIRGTPQEDFDCSWRELAYEWAPNLQPWLNHTQRRQLHDALELSSKCQKSMSASDAAETGPIATGMPSSVALLVESTFYVATDGSDDGAGTLQDPFATISHAVSVSRKAKPACTVFLRGGTHHLDAAITLDNRDSGLTIAAYKGERAIVSGGVRLTGLKWEQSMGADGQTTHHADVSSYTLPHGIPALHHRGQRVTLARYPVSAARLNPPTLYQQRTSTPHRKMDSLRPALLHL